MPCLMHVSNTNVCLMVFVCFNMEVYSGNACFQFRPGDRLSRRRFS
jgi:hypothetical protein